MKRILLLLTAASFMLLSCKDESGYINYTWDDSTVDADSDGIPDIAEAEGTSFYGMPLYDWGARPGVPDLFVHVAVMEPNILSNGYADGGMILQKKALDRVVAKFADNGIALHFDVGRSGLYQGYSELTNRNAASYNMSNSSHEIPYNKSIFLKEEYLPSGVSSSGYVFVDDIKSQYFPSNRNQIFYFFVLGSSQESDGSSGSSGVAWNSGREFLITLANWGFGFGTYDSDTTDFSLDYDQIENWTVNSQASTIMHEFGHNLGLSHGGSESLNYKPNYISIMNYLYQLFGLPDIGNEEGDRYLFEKRGLGFSFENLEALQQDIFSSDFLMDYSYGEGASLDETSLLESEGLRQIGSGTVNWNDNSETEAYRYSLDLNTTDTQYNTGTTVLSDFNDWGNLYYYYGNIAHGASRLMFDKNLEIEIEEPINMSIPSIERSH